MRAVAMNGTRYDFFACAGFAGNQHSGMGGRGARDALANFVHGRTVAVDFRGAFEADNSILQQDVLAKKACAFARATNGSADDLGLKRLREEISSERRSASWADSRSGRRSFNVKLTKIRIRLTVAHYSRRDAGTAHAAA